jgi:uncharacterized membrane protein
MRNEQEQLPPQPATGPSAFPRTGPELVNAMAHYYRGEMSRMTSWRDRIDRTTNWAITVTAAMLSVSLSTPNAHHGVLLFAMLLVMLLLAIESRRYRFFDVYRSRVRRLERNYYAKMFSPESVPAEDWMRVLSSDLRLPSFSLSLAVAMSRRLRRNYCWMLLILLLAWLLKTTSAKLQANAVDAEFVHSASEWIKNCEIGLVSGWMVIVSLAFFYSWILYATLRHAHTEGELAYGDVHV